jgi:hypothetical protein
MPRIIPEPRYFSMPSIEVGADVWEGYGKLMSAYGRKLVTLLNKGWNGPHDYYGRWVVQGETLGWIGNPLPARYRSREYPTRDQTYKGKVIQ